MRTAFFLVIAGIAFSTFGPAETENPRVVIKTELGDITVEIYADRAPLTAANFLKYVDGKLYDGTVFHRTVTLAGPRNQPIQIEVIQGGQVGREKSLTAIPLERTNLTRVKHADGAISMARGGADTATSSFFLCVGDNPDGQGFAAFGKVIAGLDVVRKIHRSPVNEGELLTPPVKILSIARIGE